MFKRNRQRDCRGIAVSEPARSRCTRSMCRSMVVVILVGLAAAAVPALSSAAPAGAAPEFPAFPGAEGFGAGATGGRGGAVVFVTTLEPFGPGSLGEALDPESCEPRTVVFRVSGVIEVPGKHDLELNCGNVTIAGQTAPGAGITLNGRIDGFSADPAGNIIIRHVRFRPPPITDEEGAVDDLGQIYDALQLSNNPNVMLDHLSVAWGSDETLDLFELATDVTIQWTTIEESNTEGQPDGPHNFGAIVGPDSPRVSIHHVLFAHHRSRCPAMAAGPAELINSVIYDCQDGFVHHNPASGEFHIAGNTFVHGPSHDEFTPMYFDDEEPGDTTYWLSQNDIQAPGLLEGVVDDISATPLAEAAFEGADPGQVISTPSDFGAGADGYAPISMQAPGEAYEAVLAQAGAFPRDAVSSRTIQEVIDRSGSWGPTEPADLLEGLAPTEPPPDADTDGMADDWEVTHGLDPADGADHSVVMPSGYTAIEEYVNGLSDGCVGAAPPNGSVPIPTVADNASEADPSGPSAASDTSAPSDASTAQSEASSGDGVAAPPNTGDDDGNRTLAIAALILGAVAVILSGYTVYAVRRFRAPPSAPGR